MNDDFILTPILKDSGNEIIQKNIVEESKQGELFDGNTDLGVNITVNSVETENITQHQNSKKANDTEKLINIFFYVKIEYFLET